MKIASQQQSEVAPRPKTHRTLVVSRHFFAADVHPERAKDGSFNRSCSYKAIDFDRTEQAQALIKTQVRN
jgi:hypothetical protein